MGVPRTASVSCMWMGYVDMICFAVHASSTLGQLTTRRGQGVLPCTRYEVYMHTWGSEPRYTVPTYSSWPSVACPEVTLLPLPPTETTVPGCGVGVTTESRDIARQKQNRWRSC